MPKIEIKPEWLEDATLNQRRFLIVAQEVVPTVELVRFMDAVNGDFAATFDFVIHEAYKGPKPHPAHDGLVALFDAICHDENSAEDAKFARVEANG